MGRISSSISPKNHVLFIAQVVKTCKNHYLLQGPDKKNGVTWISFELSSVAEIQGFLECYLATNFQAIQILGSENSQNSRTKITESSLHVSCIESTHKFRLVFEVTRGPRGNRQDARGSWKIDKLRKILPPKK